MDKKTQEVMFSSKNDEWETPRAFYNKLNNKYNFTLDPCATHKNHKCEKYYTIEEDGLSQNWTAETVFINPPYGDVSAWIKKACEEYTKKGATVVMLIPSRTDTKYWHNYIMKYASTIYFVKGRLKFGNAPHFAPFPSVVIEFGDPRPSMRFFNNPRMETMERA